jgi:hypothetical protein
MQPRYQNAEKRVGRQRNRMAASIGGKRESQLDVFDESPSIPNFIAARWIRRDAGTGSRKRLKGLLHPGFC